MNIPAKIDIDSLCQIYLVSNTPRYLYKHLRNDPSVQWMAQNISIDNLCTLYIDSQKTKEKSPREVALAYAVIAALSHISYGNALPALDGLDTKGLKWASELIDILKSTGKVIETISLEFPKSAKPAFELTPGNTSITSTNLEKKPKIEIVRS